MEFLLLKSIKIFAPFGDLVPIQQLYSDKEIRLEDTTSGNTSGKSGSLSGVGKSSNNQTKHLIINIQSLIGLLISTLQMEKIWKN